jgi:diadenylate cyclase
MLDRLSTALQIQNLSSPFALVDILILALIIYRLLLLIRGTRSVNVLVAIIALVLLYVMTGPGLIELTAVHSALGSILIYGPLATIVLFQNQIRQALANLGKNPLSALMPRRRDDGLIEEITLASASLASKRLGALIVIERGMGLRSFCDTGIALDALVSYDLLMNIFTRRSPMHDGAVIIADGRLKAASCYLPLTMNASLSRTYGTRHRAAIGITEESDALAIVVSEERGVVSLTERGKIQENLDAESLEFALHEILAPNTEEASPARGRRVVISGATDA